MPNITEQQAKFQELVEKLEESGEEFYYEPDLNLMLEKVKRLIKLKEEESSLVDQVLSGGKHETGCFPDGISPVLEKELIYIDKLNVSNTKYSFKKLKQIIEDDLKEINKDDLNGV